MHPKEKNINCGFKNHRYRDHWQQQQQQPHTTTTTKKPYFIRHNSLWHFNLQENIKEIQQDNKNFPSPVSSTHLTLEESTAESILWHFKRRVDYVSVCDKKNLLLLLLTSLPFTHSSTNTHTQKKNQQKRLPIHPHWNDFFLFCLKISLFHCFPLIVSSEENWISI